MVLTTQTHIPAKACTNVMKEALNDFGMKGGCPARINKICQLQRSCCKHTLNNSECTPDTKADDWKLKECMFHMFLLKHIFSVAMIVWMVDQGFDTLFSINDAVVINGPRRNTGSKTCSWTADILGVLYSQSICYIYLNPLGRRPCSLIDLSWFPILRVKSLLHSLVGGFNPPILVKLDHFPRGDNKNRLKPPPSIILIPY